MTFLCVSNEKTAKSVLKASDSASSVAEGSVHGGRSHHAIPSLVAEDADDVSFRVHTRFSYMICMRAEAGQWLTMLTNGGSSSGWAHGAFVSVTQVSTRPNRLGMHETSGVASGTGMVG